MSDKPTPPNSDELDRQVSQLKEFLTAHRPTGAAPEPAASTSSRPEALWNIFSLLSPVLIGLPTMVLGRALVPKSGWGWEVIGLFITAVGVSSFFGLTFAIVAACRDERRPGITYCMAGIHSILLLVVLALLIH